MLDATGTPSPARVFVVMLCSSYAVFRLASTLAITTELPAIPVPIPTAIQ
jgi:hypothetical protein